ncbi:MAG: hypothetical protein D6726_01505 [Nitrospirae bacterium]|nr:MAG: hypothetical protein D6726_01505 [Nitrospirota bacterium]
MERRVLLVVIVVLVSVLMSLGVTLGAEKSPPPVHAGKMMLEHVGMDCTICHGKSGPEGVKMGNHPGQKCTDCHNVEKPKTRLHVKQKPVKKKSPLAKSMMLEHEGMDCRICHGENGPKGMMMEHEGMECTTCHIMEEK